MLGHYKMSLERGYIAINPVFDKLITSLRTAVAETNRHLSSNEELINRSVGILVILPIEPNKS